MKVLLDHNIPHKLRYDLHPYEVVTTHYMRWTDLSNGDLIEAAYRAGFEVLITADKGVGFQLDHTSYRLGLLFLRAHPFTYHKVRLYVPAIRSVLPAVAQGHHLTLFRP